MRKYAKKLMGIVLLTVMTFAAALPVMAAKSPTSHGVISGIVSAVDAGGKNVQIIVKGISDRYAQAAQSIRDKNTLKDILGSDYKDSMDVYDVREVEGLGDVSSIQFPVTVTFQTPGITSSTKVYVLTYNETAGKWEKVEAKAGNGTVTATLNYLSVVAIVVDSDTLAGSVGGTSPKTGDMGVLPFEAAAVVLLAGAFVCLRKKEV